MKNIIIAIILLLASQYNYAQAPYSTAVQGAITPSVAAMSYGKYADTPINPSNGTMGFSIPLFSISDGTLSHGVSLSYHTGGIRIAELASEVGLGWHLNAGGVISRTVRGLPDDDDNGYLNKALELVHPSHQPQARDVADGKLDAEPDLFFFNVNGMTGKFAFDEIGEIHIIPQSNVLIEPIFQGNKINEFTLITADGTKYHFGNSFIQTSLVGNLDKHNDTWFLYKISSFDGKHEINFSYVANNYRYWVKSDCHVIKYYDGEQKQAESTCDNAVLQSVKVNSYILSSISSPSQPKTISFSTSSREDLHIHDGMTGLKYDNISLTNGSKCVKYELSQSYFRDYDYMYDVFAKHLKLDKIQKKSCSNVDEEEPYVFTYIGDKFFEPNLSSDSLQFFPKHSSKRIDHWGYYNGATINDNLDALIPFSTINTITGNHLLSYGGANRDSDEASMLIGMLQKITYPTKGYTQLNYEANRYPDYETNEQSLVGFPMETCPRTSGSICCKDFSEMPPVEKVVTLDSNMIATGRLNLKVENYPHFSNCTPSYNAARLTIYDSNDNYVYGMEVNIYGGEGITGKGINKYIKNINGIAPGIYKFVLESNLARGELNLLYTPEFLIKYAGGLRVKDIITHDGMDLNNDIKRSFTYTLDNGAPSAELFNKPTYAFIIDESNDGSSGRTALFASTGVLPLVGSEGNHIYYTQVTEHLNGNGYKKYNLKFANSNSDNIPDFPAKASLFTSDNGVLESEIIYKEDGTIEKNTVILAGNATNTYANIPGNKYASVRVKAWNGSSLYDYASSAQYSMRTGIYRPDVVVTSLDGVVQTTNYTYHNDAKLALPPIKVSISNSDGKVTESETTYLVDYEGESSVKQYFLDHNIIAIPYKTEKTVDGELLDGSKTIFSFFGDNPRPSSTERYECTWAPNGELLTGDWVTQEYFRNYNYNGLLSEYEKTGWNYVFYSYNADKLLIGQSYALHATTYDYYPNSSLLQKKTNVDGTSMSYTYDDLMRLSTVTDDNTGATSTTTYHFAPTISQKSYIKTISNFQSDPNNLSQLTSLESRQYLDGLGRPIQSVQVGQGPNGNDLISAVAYDKQGRSKYSYETFESFSNNGIYLGPTASWKKSTVDYYDSPLNRTESSTPTDWFASTTSYGTNDANDGVLNPITNQPYADGKLFKQVTTDPMEHTTTSFTDLKGRLILSRRIDDSAYDTYYIYDDKDRMVEVIPPGSTKGDANLNYFYQYDGEDKVTRKKVPSKEWMTYKYDDRDLVMAQQDGYLLNNNKWYVYNYDLFGRETKSGFYDNAVPPTVTSNPTISELLHEQIYGNVVTDPQILWGKTKTAKTKVLGSSDWITSNFTYDIAGRIDTVATTNTFMAPDTSTVEYFYDGASNAVKVKEIIKHSHPLETTTPQNIIENYSYIAANGRTTSEWITVNGQATQLNELKYTAKDELETKYVGGNANNHLQKVDYTYLGNGLLQKVNDGNASGTDLFGYQLNYYQNPNITDITIPTPMPQKNGNISSIQWAQVNQTTQLNAYVYDDLDRLTHSFTHNSAHNTSYGYDVRGNIANLARYGLVGNATSLIDSLSFKYKSHNQNILDKVTDGGLHTKGYKVNNANLPYEYDDNGNLIYDPQKGVRMKYNYLDLCEEVSWTDGRKIQFTYDASGTLLRKEVIPNTSAENTIIDYLSSIEYKANDPYIIHHSEGRFVKRFVEGNDNGLVVYPGYEEIDGGSESHVLYINQPISQDTDYDAESIESGSVLNGGLINYEVSNQVKLVDGFHASRSASFRAFMGDAGLPSEPPIWISEWDVSDHLGNLRLTYSDLDGDGSIDAATEILQTAEYYPFGLKKTASPTNTFDNLYGYNGIEEVNDFGLGVNMATFRTLDPALGRWWSVDPLAEKYMRLSPYNSMGNSPLVYNDPNGDWIHIAVGAAIGSVINVATHWDDIKEGGGFNWVKFTEAAIVGGGAGALTAATGNAAVGAGFAKGFAIGAASSIAGDAVLQGGNAVFFDDVYNPKQTLFAAGLGGLIGGVTGALTKVPAPTTTKEVTEEVFGEFIEPYANSTASGGGKSIKGNLWGDNLSESAFVNTLDDQVVVSAPRSIINPANTGIRVGSAGYKSLDLSDSQHYFSNIVDNYASYAKKFPLRGGDGVLRDLYQIEGSLRGKSGVFEWIIEGAKVTHRRFISRGILNGIPNQIPK